jgi:hypothetical protein
MHVAIATCRFKLQEVRQDPANHPYLLQADLQAWQGCTHNAASTAAGEACLRGVVSRQQSTAPLAVHVVVSGSRDEFCNPAPVGSSVCSSITPGRGSPDDWVFLSW